MIDGWTDLLLVQSKADVTSPLGHSSDWNRCCIMYEINWVSIAVFCFRDSLQRLDMLAICWHMHMYMSVYTSTLMVSAHGNADFLHGRAVLVGLRSSMMDSTRTRVKNSNEGDDCNVICFCDHHMRDMT